MAGGRPKHQVDIILRARDLATKSFRSINKSFLTFTKNIAGAAIKKAFKVFTGFITRMISLLKNLAKVATIAFGVITALVIKMGANFERQMSIVGAVMRATREEMEALEQTARMLGETTAFTATDAAKAMTVFAKAGFDATEIIKAMPAVLNLAAAGLVEVEDAASIAVSIMNKLEIGAERMEEVTNKLVAAFVGADQEITDLGEAVQGFGSIANLAEVNLTEMVASLITLAKAGRAGQQAGTGLKIVYARMSQTTGEVGRAMKDLFGSIDDGSGGFKTMAELVEIANKRMANLGPLEKLGRAVAAFGTKGGPTFADLLGQGSDAIREELRLLDDLGDIAQEIADEQLENLAGSFTKLRSVLSGVGLDLFDLGKNELKGLLDRMTDFVRENKAQFALWGKRVKIALTLVKDSLLDFVSFVRNDFSAGLTLMRNLFIASLKSMIRVSVAIAATGGQAIFAGLKLAATGSIASPLAVRGGAVRLFEAEFGRTPFRTPEGKARISEGQKAFDKAQLKIFTKQAQLIEEQAAIQKLTADATRRFNQIVIDVKDDFKDAIDPELMAKFAENLQKAKDALAKLELEEAAAKKELDDLANSANRAAVATGGLDDAMGSFTDTIKRSLGFQEARFLTLGPQGSQFGKVESNTKKTADNQVKAVGLLQQLVDSSKFNPIPRQFELVSIPG